MIYIDQMLYINFILYNFCYVRFNRDTRRMYWHFHGRLSSQAIRAPAQRRCTVRADIQFYMFVVLRSAVLPRMRQHQNGWNHHTVHQ